MQRRMFLTFLISLQDLLQHFEGAGLTRRWAGLFILLDHLVHLWVPVEPLHGKVGAWTAAEGRNENKSQFITFIKIMPYVNLLGMCSVENVRLWKPFDSGLTESRGN